jgi:hypothetical protein
VPPDAFSVVLYAFPTVPDGNDVVVIASGLSMVTSSALETWVPVLSVTSIVNEYVPAVVGVPLQAPLLEKERPGGFVPEGLVQV